LKASKLRLLLCALALFFALAPSASVYAEETVAIVKFEGPQSTAVQEKVSEILRKKGFEVVVIGDRAETPEEASLTLTATISKKKKRFLLALALWKPGEEEALKRTQFKARKAKGLPALVRKNFWKRLRQPFVALTKADASAQGGEQDAQQPKELASKESDVVVKKKAASHAAISSGGGRFEASVAVGPRIVNRRFSYKSDIFQALTTFQVPAMAAMAVDAESYYSHFGVAGSFFYVPEFNSAVNGNSADPFPTTSMSFIAGARYRHTLAGITAHLALDYGGHNFTIKGESVEKPPIPNVRYRFVRAGGGARVELVPRLRAALEGGYRHVLSAGEIASDAYFPRLGVAAFDAKAALSVTVYGTWQVELAGTLERYFFSMNPEPGDAMVAGGAADQYLGGQLLLKYEPAL
jgi:hypothetical protein